MQIKNYIENNVGIIVDIVHSTDGRLGLREYNRAADMLYIFSPLNDGTLTIRYIVLPNRLVEDSDPVDLNPLLHSCISSIWCICLSVTQKEIRCRTAFIIGIPELSWQTNTRRRMRW